MKKLSFIIVFLFPAVVTASSGGIEKPNYQISISHDNSDIGNRNIIFGEARIPLKNNLGIRLNGMGSSFDGKNNYVDSDSNAIGVGVLFRKYDIGSLQAMYLRNESNFDLPSGELKGTIDSYSLLGTWYIQSFNFTLLRSLAKADDGESLHSSGIIGSYYINNELSVSALIGGMDMDDTRTLDLTHQPKVFNDSVGVSIGYQDDGEDNSVNLSISYFFDTRVKLIDRIRRY